MPTSLQFQRASTAADSANATVSNYHHHHPHHKQLHHPVSKVSLTRGMPDVPEHVELSHTHVVGPSQCFSVVVQDVDAPASVVWSILSRFEHPQAYKHFVKSCHVALGDGHEVGSVREVRVVSGLPAAFSLERLEIMDDDLHVISFSVVGGDHRLQNYRSVTTLHESSSSEDGKKRTRVVESYVVDVPAGNDKEETCSFADTIVRCNLQSLAKLAENPAA